MAEKKESKYKYRRPDWIPDEAYEHAKAARAEMRESVKALFPPEFIERRKAARKEILMAARKMIDHAIERVEGKEKK
jgi:predicted P-loop ATPase/GTPase